jgi:FMN reductase
VSTVKIVVVSAGINVPSSTRLLADAIAKEIVTEVKATGRVTDVDVIDLRNYAVDIANNMTSGFANPRLSEAIALMEHADIIIAVTPVFTASMSGLFKSFFDVIDNKALTGKTVVIGATGGSTRHSMVLDFAMRPMFNYLKANVMPTAVYAAPEDWGDGSTLQNRIAGAAKEAAASLSGERTTHKTTSENRTFEEILAGLKANY